MIGIYKILNKKNNFLYIGKTSQDIEIRWRQHKYLLKNNKDSAHLQNAWNYYGEEFFEFSILKECKKEELKQWEEYFIELYESWNPKKGYNIERYSQGEIVVSEETKQKMSEAKKDKYNGENNPMFGKYHSDETKQKIKENHYDCRGKNNSMYGIPSPMKNKYHSDEIKLKIKESKIGENNPNSKLLFEQVKEIRQKYIPYKYTQKMLAEEYGVSLRNIRFILKNITWKENFDVH